MPSVTLGDIDARLLGGRLENNSLFFPQAERYRAINSAVKVLNLFTGFLQRTVTIYVEANRAIYDVPTGILVPARIEIDGVFLDKCGLYDLSHSHPTWLTDTSATTGVPTYQWSPIGISKFALYPAPSAGGGLLQITGIAEPTPLVSTSDRISFPNEFSDAVEDYAAHLLQIKCGGAIAAQAMVLYSQFMSRANELKRFKGKIAPQFKVEVDAAE